MLVGKCLLYGITNINHKRETPQSKCNLLETVTENYGSLNKVTSFNI